MRMLIIGSTGFVGRSIIEELSKENIDIVAIVREKTLHTKADIVEQLKRKGKTSVEVVRSLDKQELTDIFKNMNPDTIIFSAGIIRGKREDFEYVHIKLPSIIMDSIRSSDIDPLYIHVSSTGASNFQIDERPLPEEKKHCEHMDKLPTIYEKSKCIGEKVVVEKSMEHGIRYVILRPNIIVGRLNRHREWINIIKLAKLGIKMNFDGVTNILDAEDLAKLIHHIMSTERGVNDYYHVASPHNIYIYRISEIALDVVGRKAIISLGPLFAKFLRAFVMDEMMKRMLEFLNKDSRISIDKLIAKTGYSKDRFKDPESSMREMFMSILNRSTK